MSDWEEVRHKVLARLRQIRQHIDRQDEGNAMALINQQDEFCDSALEARAATPLPVAGQKPVCHFCTAFLSSGGCMGMLEKVDHAILAGNWEAAGRATDQYIEWVERLPSPSAEH